MYCNEEISLQIAEKVHPSVVRVVPAGVRNMTAEGSGFVVLNIDLSGDEDRSIYILTAAHVTSGSKNITVHFSKNNILSANLIACNDRMDLALLHISEPCKISSDSVHGKHSDFIPLPLPLTLMSQAPKVGQLAFANGYLPLRKQMEGIVMTSGIVCGMSKGVGVNSNREDSNTTYILTNAGMAPGMSGGPVVDKNGLVIGVNSLIRLDLGTLGNCAISSQECVGFINYAFNTFSKKALGYRVLLYNDPMNKRQRVANILTDIAKLSSEEANECMMLAHTKGSSVVREFLISDEDNCDCLINAKKMCEDLINQDILSVVEKILVVQNETVAGDSQILIPF